MSLHGLDAFTSQEIFRKDHPMILASNRHLASIKPVRLAYDADGYVAGQVLGRNSVSGYFQKYDSGGASGLDTATCILFEEVTAAASSGTTIARGIFAGEVYKSKLTDLDSGAETDLKARTIVDATGIEVLKF